MTSKCIPCRDIIQELYGDKLHHMNYLADVFYILNVVLVLFVIGMGQVNKTFAIRIAVLYVCLMIFRQILMKVTECDLDVNAKHRPRLSSDTKWYIVSGHTVGALMLTIILLNSQCCSEIQILSLWLSGLVMYFLIITKEHKTVDIMITIALVWLTFKAFGYKTHVK